ncbi:hypothetical protein H6761_00190 [Candidatus Nomurabacteria bacterium]|nr:hypothetical protein [Candidatus Nomurabacteria bacterium]
MDLKTTIYILNVVLALGTIYAWYQFAKVVMNKCDTCSVGLHQNPFKSKCFVGAVFFSLAFVFALYALIIL